MSLLYKESNSLETSDLEAHLASCRPCREQLAVWSGAMGRLDQWPAAAASSPRPASWFRTPLAWGIAAAFLLFTGAGFGRLSAALANDPERLAEILEPKLRASLKASEADRDNRLRQQLRSDLEQQIAEAAARARSETDVLIARMDNSTADSRARDKEEIVNLLKQLERDQLARWATLRKDLETVAIVGEVRIRNAQMEIGQIASNTRPISSSASDSQ